MFTPVLLFAFSGIVAGISTLLKNPTIMGDLANPDGLWYQIWWIVEQGAWTVFNHMPLIFVIGLPIGLAKKQNARACLEALVTYLTFNYFLNAILTLWGPSFGVDFTQEVGGGTGLAMIAGIKTLDMGMIGAILISALVVFLHNKYFDTELPEFLGVFKGSSFVCILGFMLMIPMAFGCALVWPKIQMMISSLQSFLAESGIFGVGVYSFLNRALIPTGMHHFVYSPFQYDNIVVDGGLTTYWIKHLEEFASSGQPLIDIFPQGGFMLYGMTKVFGAIGISIAFYLTSKQEKRKKVMGLLIPATLTAVVAGITEPLEFTFLFIAPMLFFVHSLLTAFLDMTMYAFGVVGNFGGGLIDFISLNWIPLGHAYWQTYLVQMLIGVVYIGVYIVIFRFLILKFDFKTPGREDEEEEIKLYTKADYKEKQSASKEESGSVHQEKARAFLEALGGKTNIEDVTNCATRLRLTIKDESLVQDGSVFKVAGAQGLVAKGKAVQIIVGLSVATVRDEFERLLD